jgi:hypothetical protein
MGGFAEGDAVQVDVGSAGAISSVESSPYTLHLSATERSLLAIKSAPERPDTALTRSLLSNLDIHIADFPSATQYDPASLQYMLDFFRTVAQSIPPETSSQGTSAGDDGSTEPLAAAGAAGGRDDANKRAGIIVLREDLDF